jgi:hypothetical protein
VGGLVGLVGCFMIMFFVEVVNARGILARLAAVSTAATVSTAAAVVFVRVIVVAKYLTTPIPNELPPRHAFNLSILSPPPQPTLNPR